MKRRQIWKKQEAVSPVIATILMVAITVVLAATLYMMLPGADEGDTTAAMSGRVRRVTDGWLVEIDGGNVRYNDGEGFILYNVDTGVSESMDEADPTDPVDGEYIFNDNDENERVNSGDSILIYDADKTYEDEYQFRIEGTNLRLTLN